MDPVEKQRLLRDTMLQRIRAKDEYRDPNPPYYNQRSNNGHAHEQRPHPGPDYEVHDFAEGDISEVTLKEAWKIGIGSESVAVEVFVYDEDYHYPYQILFWITVAELAMALIFALISVLVLSDTYENNNYLFTVIGSILSVVIVMILHGCSMIRSWSRSSKMSHNHNTKVRMPFFFGAFLLGVGFFVMGRWVSDNCDCCSTSECQPDITDFDNFVEFYAAWGTMLFVNIVWIHSIIPALIAHINPEEKVPTTSDPRKTKLPLEFQIQQKKADKTRATMQQKGAEIMQLNSNANRRKTRG
jgi:hypothetical protein